MPCLSSLLEITALVASLVPWECKQAIILSQEDKQGVKLKEGAIKCCKEKMTSPPPELRNIPFSLNKKSSIIIRSYSIRYEDTNSFTIEAGSWSLGNI